MRAVKPDRRIALTLRMPEELHDQLRQVAEDEDRTISGLLRVAAQEFLASRGATSAA